MEESNFLFTLQQCKQELQTRITNHKMYTHNQDKALRQAQHHHRVEVPAPDKEHQQVINRIGGHKEGTTRTKKEMVDLSNPPPQPQIFNQHRTRTPVRYARSTGYARVKKLSCNDSLESVTNATSA